MHVDLPVIYRNQKWTQLSFLSPAWLLCPPLLVILGLLTSILPAYLFLILSISFILSLLFLIKPKLSLFLLICLVPIHADWLGLHLSTRWSNPLSDMMPLWVPIAIVSFLGLSLRKAAGLQTEPPRYLFNKLFLLLLCWALILLLWSPNLALNPIDTSKGKVVPTLTIISRASTPLNHDFFQLFILGSNILLFCLFTNSVENEFFHRRLMWTWIIFGTIVAIFTIGTGLSGAESLRNAVEIFDGLKLKLQLVFDPVRSAGIGTPHLTSFFLNLVLAISLGMLLTETRRSAKVFLGVAAFLMMLANSLTLTKGALAALVIMLHFFLLTFARLKKHFFRNVILLYAFLLLVFILQINISKESKVRGSPRFIYKKGYSIAVTGRSEINWIPGIKYFLKTGAVGLGPGTYTYATISPHSHSIYFSIIFDFGFVGIGIFLVVLLAIARNYFQMVRFQRTYLQIMFLACCAGLISMGIHGLVDFEYNTPLIWLFLGIYSSTHFLAEKELAEKP